MNTRWAFILILFVPGCTFQPGGAWTTLAGAELDLAQDAGEARDLGDFTFLTRDGASLAVDRFELDVGDLELVSLIGADNVDFDPANPPAGYGLCHGGHCHRDDGALISYAEITAEMAGGGAALVTVATLPVGATVDLREGGALRLTQVEPSPDLDQGSVAQLQLSLRAVRMDATLSSLEDPSLSVPLRLDLPVSGSLSTDLELTIDRDFAPRFFILAEAAVDGALFDDSDLVNLAGTDPAGLVIDDPADPVASAFLDRLILTPLSAALRADGG